MLTFAEPHTAFATLGDRTVFVKNFMETGVPRLALVWLPPRRRPGQQLGPYVATRLLGDGTFGRVLEATGPQGQRVAVKVIRDVKKYVEAAKIEAQARRARRSDPGDRRRRC